LNAAWYATGEEPIEVAAVASTPADNPRFRDVPESISFSLRFSSGVLAHCDCSFVTAHINRYRVHCAWLSSI